MTPFAQLATQEKSASHTGNPYSPALLCKAAGDAPPSEYFDNGWANLGADIAAGTNPFSGVPYYGYKAYDDFSNGNIWSGIGNIGWGALSFGGLGGVGGVAKGGVKGLKGLWHSLRGAKGARSAMRSRGTVTGLVGAVGSDIAGEGTHAFNQPAAHDDFNQPLTPNPWGDPNQKRQPFVADPNASWSSQYAARAKYMNQPAQAPPEAPTTTPPLQRPGVFSTTPSWLPPAPAPASPASKPEAPQSPPPAATTPSRPWTPKVNKPGNSHLFPSYT